ncbi:hypothetical protein G4P54_19120 [Bacillus tequilensis]|uniref:Uncharacterized protein n=1 Tax=Bacillus tequilensis TaxID=227866 RepID=A0A6H0WNP7_9BACI|nr:hypothetical protein [Bacillus tequilensis]MDR4433373.1 hypothetical protein [Bacillus tequilensis]QIW81744.1 hypothetical protein G4P54_19120 [Bacillus tequilensis]
MFLSSLPSKLIKTILLTKAPIMGGSVTDRSSFMLKKECALADDVQKQQIYMCRVRY